MDADRNAPVRREHPEPREAHHPVPVAIIALVALLLGWAGGYLMGASPDAAAARGDQRSPAAGAVAAAAAPAVDGAAVFAANCAACHQAQGTGLPQVFPPLAGSEWVQGDKALLAQILLHGINGPIEVAGQVYNGQMPAFGQTLGDAEIAAVASHIRSQWGNHADALGVEDIAEARRLSAARTTPWAGAAELVQHTP